MRISRKTLPDGIYAYDLRDRDDCSGNLAELRNFVLVNHLGTVITKEPIEGADDGIVLEEKDYSYLGEEISLEEFTNSAPKMEQSM